MKSPFKNLSEVQIDKLYHLLGTHIFNFKKDDEILEEEGEEALHASIKEAKESAKTDEEKAIARYREVREMRRIVERTHLEILDEMERLHIDYYGASKNPIPLIKVPDYEP